MRAGVSVLGVDRPDRRTRRRRAALTGPKAGDGSQGPATFLPNSWASCSIRAQWRIATAIAV